MSRAPTFRGNRAARPLADFIHGTIAESCARRGLAAVEIVTHWPDIVGSLLAARALPTRLAWPTRQESDEPAVLHVRVEGGYAIELQHDAPIVIERINRYFGWRCVGRLALRQAPVGLSRPVQRRVPPPDAAACDAATRRMAALGISGFEDERLASALARLGACVAREGRR
ncbi:DciA family protein [Ancylobacter sp. 6x-1]|uniref:DciA family protein n=1 Tax=Ancylobacter crimeensis TaxID=2579147 RepID=A0ABT0D7P0_9HYPH|nr:DciA family protein [Ancylobacter crimeensis]MCK0195963.1 DciA family protein [Ancylobacter crimeensis]